MTYIRQLSTLTKHDLPLAGGKGANLGELIQAGLPVPPGFVLLTTAYQRFIRHNNLQDTIEHLTATLKPSELAVAEQISLAIRTLFAEAVFPADLITAITQAYTQLNLEATVVRSSATAEDLPTGSFAGQHESYLHIRTLEDLLASIQRCWSSLWTARALLYRTRQGITSNQLALAVIIQELIPATSSGVIFTVNPLNGDQDELLINATWGLGEILVSGQVTPDTIVVGKTSTQVKQLTIGSKTQQLLPAYEQSGTIVTIVNAEQQQQPALSNEQISNLVELAHRTELHFGTPQDIEWAATPQMIYLVQARPITTHAPQQTNRETHIPVPPGNDSWNREHDLPPQAGDLWTRTNVGENLPFPITPLTDTNFPAVFGLDKPDPKQTYQMTRRIYGRMYLNEGGMIYNFNKEFGLPASFLTRSLGTTQRKSYPNTFHLLRFLRKLPTLLTGMSALSGKSKMPKHNAEQFFAQINTWVAEFRVKDLRAMNDLELWQAGLPTWSTRGQYAFNTNLRLSTRGTIYYPLAWLIKRWTGEKNLAQVVITSPIGVLSSAIGPALWQMAQCLQVLHLADLVLHTDATTALHELRLLPTAQPFIEQLDQFLAIHGHRCPNELEFLNPRWEEAPEQVITLIANYLQADERTNPLLAMEKQQQQRAEAIALIEKKIDPIRRKLFRLLLAQTQEAIVIRENSKYHMSKFLYPLRLLYAELGRRWQERGWLKQPDDIFFLVISEIQDLCEHGLTMLTIDELQARIAQRRLAYDFWLTMHAPAALDAQGQILLDENNDVQNILKGVPASSGRVRGRARLVQTVAEAMQLQPGDILVTMATDPGWTPVFPLVSGLILEIGGQLSHGAIIAREFGLPAVINVPDAMRRIQDGQFLEIDGTNGMVYLESEQPAALLPVLLP